MNPENTLNASIGIPIKKMLEIKATKAKYASIDVSATKPIDIVRYVFVDFIILLFASFSGE
jgi:hypothetical protein